MHKFKKCMDLKTQTTECSTRTRKYNLMLFATYIKGINKLMLLYKNQSILNKHPTIINIYASKSNL